MGYEEEKNESINTEKYLWPILGDYFRINLEILPMLR
jgi:hypothetical protein